MAFTLFLSRLLIALVIGPPAANGAPAGWPGNPAGLVFLWEDASRTNQVTTAAGKAVRTCQAEPRGMARYGRFFDMDLTGGAFVARGVDAALLAACRKSGQLGIEALITPRGVGQKGPAQIITFSSGRQSRNFALSQEEDRLILQLRTSSAPSGGYRMSLFPLSAGKPHHVIVSYAPGRLAAYLDGEPVKTSSSVRGDFRNWAPQYLLFGEEWDRRFGWDGRLEGIAIHSRTIPPDEAQQRYALYSQRLKKRRPAPQLVVQARLAKVTPTPTLQAIAPYRRALVVNEYVVEKVLEGRYDQPKIVAAHWVILDGKTLPNNRKVGTSYRLRLERFTDHPQLERERLMMDSDELDVELF
jgi:hypothetical protein